MLKANGCDVNLYGNKGFTLSSDISAVATATKLDLTKCYLHGACGCPNTSIERTHRLSSGEISQSFFSLLCGLDQFDLRGNGGINQKTLAGHLACNLTNLKDQSSIDASGKRLTGSPCARVRDVPTDPAQY